jgi:hypothetical protein
VRPLQIAKSHCANFQNDGSCLGIYFNDDLTVRMVRPLPKCLLAGPIQRCEYFDECVAPMKLENKNPGIEAKMREDFAAGIRQYNLATGIATEVALRVCPNCKRRPLQPRKKLCAECRTEKRNETKRASRRKTSVRPRQFSEKSPSIGAAVL